MASAGGHGETNVFRFALIAPEAEVEKVDAVIESHHEFMEETHSLDGDMQTCLNSHPVIKLAKMVDFTDPSKVTTGNIINILSEC